MSKSVLITGASSGLGLETAVFLASRGFAVYAGLRDLERRSGLDAEAARRGVSLTVLPLDVTRRDHIRSAVQYVLGQSGAIHALVNNAGVAAKGFFEDLSEDEIRNAFEVNVFGSMAMTRAVLPAMRGARQGRVLFITSLAGLLGSPAYSAYSASKFSLEGFGESLRPELAPFGIHVSLIEPGFVRTRIWDPTKGLAGRALDPESPYSQWYERLEQMAQRMVAASPVLPADVARTVHRVLTDSRPALRYMIGWRARFLLGLFRYVPGQGLKDLYFRGIVRQMTSEQAPTRREGR